MTRGQKPNFKNTIIYKIVCNDLNITDCYVGHTTHWINRKYYHKTNCNNPNSKIYNLKIYKFIRDNGGWSNWDMIEICKYPCNDSKEAHSEERRHYELLNSSLNSVIPYKSKDELLKWFTDNYEKNKEEILSKQKIFYNQNKERLLEKKKIKVKCECGCEVSKSHLARHRKSTKHLNLIN